MPGNPIDQPITREELKAARLELGLSQSKMARLMGIEMNTLARKERGDRPISLQDSIILRGIMERHEAGK